MYCQRPRAAAHDKTVLGRNLSYRPRRAGQRNRKTCIDDDRDQLAKYAESGSVILKVDGR